MMNSQRRNDLHKLDVYRCALELYGETTELIVALDCVEIDQLAPACPWTVNRDREP